MLDVSDYNAPFFGQWLRRKRHQRDLTVSQLADRAGVSKQYVSLLERSAAHPVTGKHVQPGLDKVESLAEALGADVDEARMMAGYEPTQAPEQFESDGLFKGIEKLSPEMRKVAEIQINTIIKSLLEASGQRDFDYIDEASLEDKASVVESIRSAVGMADKVVAKRKQGK